MSFNFDTDCTSYLMASGFRSVTSVLNIVLYIS